MVLTDFEHRGRRARLIFWWDPREWGRGREAWPRGVPFPILRLVKFGPFELIRHEHITEERAEANNAYVRTLMT